MQVALANALSTREINTNSELQEEETLKERLDKDALTLKTTYWFVVEVLSMWIVSICW